MKRNRHCARLARLRSARMPGRLPKLNLLALAACMGVTHAQDTKPAQGATVEQVVITGVRRSQSESLNIKRGASNIVDSVVAEDVGKLPDVNVAEALQRVPGVTVGRSNGEGKTIAVRGLGAGFNVTTLNGRKLASEDPDRQFNYDVLASELISRIIVNKSSQAPLPEGGIGAVVDINTYRPFMLGDGTLMLSAFGVHDEAAKATNPRLAALYSRRFANDTVGVLVTLNYSKRDLQQDKVSVTQYDKDFPGSAVTGLPAASLYTVPAAFGLQRDDRQIERQGGTLAIQFRPGESLEVNVDALYNRYADNNQQYVLANLLNQSRYWPNLRATQPKLEGNKLTGLSFQNSGGVYPYRQNESYSFPRTTRLSQVGANLSYKPSDKLQFGIDVSSSTARRTDDKSAWQIVTKTFLDTASYDWTGTLPSLSYAPYTGTGGATVFERAVNTGHTVKNTVDELKLSGEWSPGQVFDNVRFGLNLSNEKKQNDQYRTPTQNAYYGCQINGNYYDQPNNVVNGFSFGSNNSAGNGCNFLAPTSIFSKRVDNFLGAVDGNIPRQFQGMDIGSSLSWLQQFSQAVPASPWVNTPSAWDLLKAQWMPLESYAIQERVMATYIDAEQTGSLGGMRYQLNPGLRIAKTEQKAAGYRADPRYFYANDVNNVNNVDILGVEWGEATPYSRDRSYTDVLPSINFSLKPTPELQLRLAAAKVLSRAPITDLRPGYDNVNPRGGLLATGNPDLEPFRAVQYDATLEWYYQRSGALLVGYFYKDIKTLIARGTRPETVTLTATTRCAGANYCNWNGFGSGLGPQVSKTFNLSGPFNSEGASVSGLEVAWQQALDPLSPSLKGFGLIFNGTFADSKTRLVDRDNNALPVENLSKFSYNLIGYYESSQFGVRLAYNWRDKYLLSSGLDPIYHAAVGWLDASLYYNVNKNVSLNVYASNLLDAADKATYGSGSGPFNGQMNYQAYTGRSIGIGARVKF